MSGRRRLGFLAGCIAAVAAAWGSGCAGGAARTTRLQTRDFQDIAGEVAASLRASDWLRGRDASSPPITVAVRKVENLSSDMIGEGERWYLVDRVLNDRAMEALRAERNIRFVIPEERLRALRRSVGDDERIAAERRPTHTMTARLRSVTRAAGADRTDLYGAQYTVADLDTGETVWTGEFLLKRAASGRSYN